MERISPALKIWIPAIILIAGVLVIAFESYRITAKNTAEAFNTQQLFLVRESARSIEALANNIETSLKTCADLLAFYPKERILKSLFSNQQNIIQSLFLISNSGQAVYSYPQEFSALSEIELNFNKILSSARAGKASLTNLIFIEHENKPVLSFVMGVPVKKTTQWLFCILNSSEIKNNFIYPIRSGRTGYAWMIDCNGVLFAHPNKDMEGRKAMDVLKELWPKYSSLNLEAIINKEMTKGEEGKGEYTGWHLGEKKLTKKLIAYSPIDFKGLLLSIGVSAPYNEVMAPLIESLTVPAIFLALFILLIIVSAFQIVVQTNRKRLVNQELTWSQEVFDGLADGISIIDRNYRVLMVNKAVCEWQGKPQHFFKAKPCYIVFQQHEGVCEGCPAKETFLTGKPAFREKVSTVLGGKKYYFHLATFPLKDKNGDTVRVAECVKDVTKEMALRSEIIQHERKSMIVKMSAQVAHEIRNPLGTLTLNIDLLEDEINSYSGIDITEATELVSTIKSELDGLHNILKEYLECTRFPKIKPEIQNINTILKNLFGFIEEELRRKKIVFKTNYEKNLPLTNVDQDLIRGAFLNIIRNSVEAMETGGFIEVTTRATDGWIEIVFTDTGTGIPEGQTEKIFAPFFTTKSGGTGLGLSITQHVVTEHKGEIEYESNGHGNGTCFKIRIPMHKENEDLF